MNKTFEKGKDEMKQEIDKAMNALYRVRDELRVRMHLATMDARDAWTKLEPKIEDAEKRAAELSEGALSTITSTTSRLEQLLASIGKPS